MATIIEYFVLALGLGCILIGLGGWLLPYLKRFRGEVEDDLDDDDADVSLGMANLQTLARAGIRPVVVEAPEPSASPGSESRPRTDLLSAVAASEAPSEAVARRSPEPELAEAPPQAEQTAEADDSAIVEDEEREAETAGLDAYPIEDETEAETAAESETPAAGDEPDADLLALFAEVAEESKVPAVLKEAIEDVTIEALLREVLEVRALMDKPSR